MFILLCGSLPRILPLITYRMMALLLLMNHENLWFAATLYTSIIRHTTPSKEILLMQYASAFPPAGDAILYIT